jgi:hypothetical protein
MNPLFLISTDPCVKVVGSFEELVTTPFGDGVNALCWPRELPGDFAEVAGLLQGHSGITPLDEALLRSLPVSLAGQVAIDVLLADQQRLRDHGLHPELNCIVAYPREEKPGAVRTDVYSFHADSAPAEADTWLCTYHGAPSEGLRNDEAQRRVQVPETRAALLAEFGGPDDEDFSDHLEDNCYDLHYVAVGQAQAFSFGVGPLWRIAVEYPGSPVPPCIHRAPEELPGQPPRLLLIS